ncbi:hypothetical protein Cgig2_027064 [Carnegiea gigantea]|uniref:SBP-type domain-containing protein n=1 Tax=Carnegiea gigantea TaxID=171969 RepID=A0A9Q1QEA5_9CARY|nr:hypothetical protein Cgig2_027064 [Carnegiea gigantea]
MNAISMMELNAKSPFIWDWENLVMSNTKGVEAPKKLQLVDSDIDGIEGFEVGSFYSLGGRSDGGTGSGSGSGSGSDLGYASSSRSSKSASVDSRADREMKGTNFTLETTRTSPTIDSSAASGESLIALELGKRTFFEDASAASNPKNSALPPSCATKKSKPSSLSTEIPRCQVEGCNLDLSSAKDYHRKHRVCENHSKSPKVVINGLERRFCQQCSRFHGLSEFDQKKRSCRRRLSDHNARRRKPKPEVIQFNSMRMAPSLYDTACLTGVFVLSSAEGRNQLSFSFNHGPMIQSSQSAWGSPSNPKVAPAKPSLFSTVGSGAADELHSAQNGLQNLGTKLSPVSTHFLTSKGATSEVFQRGLAVSLAQSDMDGAQDLRALSLLSTSWGSSCDPSPSPSPSPFNQPSIHANQASLPQTAPAMNTVPLDGISSEFWQPPISAGPPPSHTSSTFQLFKAPNESSFYLY